MTKPLSFFTPVSYGHCPKSFIEGTLEFVDGCLSFKGSRAVVVFTFENHKSKKVEILPHPKNTAFKVACWAVCFFAIFFKPVFCLVPIILVGLKIILRATHLFHLEIPDLLNSSRKFHLAAQPGKIEPPLSLALDDANKIEPIFQMPSSKSQISRKPGNLQKNRPVLTRFTECLQKQLFVASIQIK